MSPDEAIADLTAVKAEFSDKRQPLNRYPKGQQWPIVTVEGVSAVTEAIEAMKKLKKEKPLQPLKWNKELTDAAKFHANDMGPKGLMSHDSSDGTTAGKRIDRFLQKQTEVSGFGECMSAGMTSGKDVVLQLLIDDGVKSRGHRANMTNTAF